ncbi:MAG: beta-lactamase family protein [Gammaproteobacteria bacterium]|jgi:CubicO group peptidase (beta-lactamase class C family)|nr:beta-lactamase family protein [Gammaproteobacteria bacterium]MBT5154885.1 beta-lactamase family protein [Gammaproteobacteria bacterium]MBT5723238.1 beta-lactamase family protein [Gammaproteobacteria bacterium]MBT6892198.1 beta-lactamase family protein [Gammaproteobacteria bacterium]MBT7876460.1 beta-lactamase family protein [Gammaproteobacteria bacterium]
MNIVQPESIGLSSKRLTRISGWLEQQMEEGRLAGGSVLIGRRGQVGYFETAGVADLDTGEAFSREAIVRAYSMTKPIVTAAAMMLYEEGCFQLDHPISTYLPEFTSPEVWTGGELSNTVPAESPIAVWHIMSHTSGLTYGFMQANVVDAEYRARGIEQPSPNINLEEWVKALSEIPLICHPGSEWNYSVSTDVLGRLVEVWSGMSLDVFLEERIFKPLGMVDTGFFVRAENKERLSAMYGPKVGAGMGGVGQVPLSERGGLKLLDKAEGSRYLAPANLLSGGGGLVSTMEDYSRFCQMMLNGGELDGERLLAPSTIKHMRSNHLPDGKDMSQMGQPVWSETSYEGIGFGLGFAVVIDPIKAAIVASPGEHHWGGAASTFFWLDPVEDLWAIFLTQLLPSSTYPFRRELRTLVYQAVVD